MITPTTLQFSGPRSITLSNMDNANNLCIASKARELSQNTIDTVCVCNALTRWNSDIGSEAGACPSGSIAIPRNSPRSTIGTHLAVDSDIGSEAGACPSGSKATNRATRHNRLGTHLTMSKHANTTDDPANTPNNENMRTNTAALPSLPHLDVCTLAPPQNPHDVRAAHAARVCL